VQDVTVTVAVETLLTPNPEFPPEIVQEVNSKFPVEALCIALEEFPIPPEIVAKERDIVPADALFSTPCALPVVPPTKF
jgi:hypothetical protein